MNSLTVFDHDGVLVVDSRLIAQRLGIQHKNFVATIEKYRTLIEQRFGQVAFETETVTNTVGAVNEIKYYWLTEPQATILMTFSKNTDIVVQCKLDLVEAFEKAKQVIKTVIPTQRDRIRELELHNENLKMELAVRHLDNTMLTLHGTAVVLTLRGARDQLVEIEKPVLEVIDEKHNVKFKGQSLTQIQKHLEKVHGIKFKSGAELKRYLEKHGGGDLIAQSPRSILADYVPDENLEKVYEILKAGKERQMLLGE